MTKLIGTIKDMFTSYSIIIIILVALFGLLVDGPSFRNKGFQKEYRIVKFISYSYIAVGIILFVLLRII